MFFRPVDVLTIGGATLDIMLTTSEYDIIDNPQDITRQQLIAFEFGAKILTNDININYGGGAANAAVNLAQIGFSVATKLNLGDDTTGDEIKHYLHSKKINTKYISQNKNTLTAVSAIISTDKSHDHVAFVNRGANLLLDVKIRELRQLEPKWIYVTSLSGENAYSNLVKVFDYIKESKAKLAWNPGSRQIKLGCQELETFLQITHILHINKDEAIEMALSAGVKTDNIEKLLKTLHQMGPKIVIITSGEDGAWAYDGDEIYFQESLPVDRVNTTGAGDAFGSTFLAAYIKKDKNINYALAAATVSSSEVIKQHGAQKGLVSWKEIRRLIRKYSLI